MTRSDRCTAVARFFFFHRCFVRQSLPLFRGRNTRKCFPSDCRSLCSSFASETCMGSSGERRFHFDTEPESAHSATPPFTTRNPHRDAMEQGSNNNIIQQHCIDIDTPILRSSWCGWCCLLFLPKQSYCIVLACFCFVSFVPDFRDYVERNKYGCFFVTSLFTFLLVLLSLRFETR